MLTQKIQHDEMAKNLKGNRKTIKEKKELLAKLKECPIIQVVCKRTGIVRSTYYRWREEDKLFEIQADEAIKNGVVFISDMAESQLLKKVQEGNMTAIIFLLKHNCPKYNEKITHRYEIERPEKLSDEKQAEIRKAFKNMGLEAILKKDKEIEEKELKK